MTHAAGGVQASLLRTVCVTDLLLCLVLKEWHAGMERLASTFTGFDAFSY